MNCILINVDKVKYAYDGELYRDLFMVSIPFAFCGPTSIAGGQALPPRPLIYYLALEAIIYCHIRALGAFPTLSDLQALGAFVQCCDSMSLHLATKWLWEPMCKAVTSCGSMSLKPLSSGSGSLILVVRGSGSQQLLIVSPSSPSSVPMHIISALYFICTMCSPLLSPVRAGRRPSPQQGAARDPPLARCLVHQVRVEDRWGGVGSR